MRTCSVVVATIVGERERLNTSDDRMTRPFDSAAVTISCRFRVFILPMKIF